MYWVRPEEGAWRVRLWLGLVGYEVTLGLDCGWCSPPLWLGPVRDENCCLSETLTHMAQNRIPWHEGLVICSQISHFVKSSIYIYVQYVNSNEVSENIAPDTEDRFRKCNYYYYYCVYQAFQTEMINMKAPDRLIWCALATPSTKISLLFSFPKSPLTWILRTVVDLKTGGI